MPTVYQLNLPPNRNLLASDGTLASGYKLFVYQAGGSTKATSYQDSAGSTANSNPVVLDSRGEFDGLYVESGTYKLVFAPDTDTDPPTSAIWTEDNLTPVNDVTAGSASEWVASGLTPTYVSATSFTVVGDHTATLHANRRIRVVDSGGTDYGNILSSAYSAPNTTVTVVLDDGASLDSGLSTLSYSLISAVDGATTLPDPESMPRAIFGLETSNGTDAAHDIDVTAGVCVDSTGLYWMRMTADTLILDSGTGLGRLDTGVITADTGYYIWALAKPSGESGFIASTASALGSVTKPTGYTLGRIIAYVHADSAANIEAYTQVGDSFFYDDWITDTSESLADETAETQAVAAPASSTWKGVASLSNVTLTAESRMVIWIWTGGATEPTGDGEGVFNLNLGSDVPDGVGTFCEALLSTSSSIAFKATEADGDATITIRTRGFVMHSRSYP